MTHRRHCPAAQSPNPRLLGKFISTLSLGEAVRRRGFVTCSAVRPSRIPLPRERETRRDRHLWRRRSPRSRGDDFNSDRICHRSRSPSASAWSTTSRTRAVTSPGWIHQLQRTRASTLFSVSCGFVSEDFARQATNPSGRTSTAPVAVIP
jgi:hypothetical protein